MGSTFSSQEKKRKMAEKALVTKAGARYQRLIASKTDEDMQHAREKAMMDLYKLETTLLDSALLEGHYNQENAVHNFGNNPELVELYFYTSRLISNEYLSLDIPIQYWDSYCERIDEDSVDFVCNMLQKATATEYYHFKIKIERQSMNYFNIIAMDQIGNEWTAILNKIVLEYCFDYRIHNLFNSKFLDQTTKSNIALLLYTYQRKFCQWFHAHSYDSLKQIYECYNVNVNMECTSAATKSNTNMK